MSTYVDTSSQCCTLKTAIHLAARCATILFLMMPGMMHAAPGTGTDLGIGKTASATSSFVGDIVTFNIAMTNSGFVTASNVTGSDVVPSGFVITNVFSTGSPSAPIYNPTNGIWTQATFSAGSVATLTITTIATNAGVYVNTAQITGASPPNTNANNSSSVTVTLATQPADLGVSQTVGLTNGTITSHFNVGDAVVFSITLTNLGPGIPFNITGSDVVPPGFTIYEWSSSAPNIAPVYNPATGVWTLGYLYPNETASLNIYATATGAGAFTNTVSVTGASVTDPNTNNNTSSVPVTVAAPPPQADFQVTKTASTNTVQLGQQVVFSVTLQDLGPDNVTNFVVVSDCLPSGFQYVTDSTVGGGSNGFYNPSSCLWQLPTVVTTGTIYHLFITAQGSSIGMYTNTASVAVPSGVIDPNFNNNTSSVPMAVVAAPPPPQADLQVTKTSSTNAVQLGQQVVFTVTLKNLGPNNIPTNVVVMDCLPAGFTYVTDSTVGGGTNGTYSPGTCLWTLPNAIATNAIYNLFITAQGGSLGMFTNTASVVVPSGVVDPNLNNNTSSVPLAVIAPPPQADLQVTKTASTNTVKFGQTVIFNVMLQNLGPNNVTNSLVVTDSLPAGFTYVTDSTVGGGTNGTYSPGTSLWTLPAGIATNAIYNLSISALATNVGMFTNTATVGVPQGVVDPNLNNNSASAMVKVNPLVADLQVTKMVFTNSMPAFSTFGFVFTITVTNLGPDTVSNLTVTDLLPAGLPFSGAISNTGSTYTPSSGLWTIAGSVAMGQGATIMLVANAANSSPGAYTNTATVNVPAGVTDPNLTNNTASVVVYVQPVYRVIGYVYNCSSNGLPLANVSVRITGNGINQTTTTIASGNFSFNTVSNGNYTVTPVQPGNVFMPASQAVTVSNAWVTLPPFIGGVGLIYGQLTYTNNGSPITNHPVTLSGGSFTNPPTVLTDGNGFYIFTNTGPAKYTVTPVQTNGYIFTPTNAVVTLNASNNCAAMTNFASGSRIVQLVALEVVQVSQNWSNSVPLIQAKTTYLRAFLQLPTNGPAVLVQGARLYGTGAGGALPSSPLAPYAPGGSPDLVVQTTNAGAFRGILTSNLNFKLPESWTMGTINLQFVCTNNITVIPTNVVPANSTVQVTYVPTAVPPLKFYGFNWTNAGALQIVNAGLYAAVPSRVVAVYPVPDITATRAVLVPPTILFVPTAIPPTIPARDRNIADWTLLNCNAKLLQIQTFDRLVSRVFGGRTNWIYTGILAGPTPGTLGWAGTYVTPANTEAEASFISSAYLLTAPLYGPASARQTIPHEIGHVIGLPHDITNGTSGAGPCGSDADAGTPVYPLAMPVPAPAGPIVAAMGPMANGVNPMVFGLDTYTLFNNPAINPVANPINCFDLMGYCRGGSLMERWSSSYIYAVLRTNINNLFAPPPPAPPPAPVHRWFLLRGALDRISDDCMLQPFWSISSTVTNPPTVPQPGNYEAILYDGNGNIVQTIPFTPQPFIVEETDDEDEGLFNIPVLENPAVQQVQIVDTVSNTMIASITASTNLPAVTSVTLSATNGGAFTGSGPLVVSWTASDADPNAQLVYSILYSTDAGATWETIDTDLPGQTYQIDSQYLRASSDAMIGVSVSDGFNSPDPMLSSVFTVPNHPPVLSILSPADGTMFIGDQQIVFDAFVTDPQDGPLDGASVQWVSSLDGPLGSGAELDLEATDLSEGTHLITVTATDSEGLTNSSSVQIYVLRQGPPQLTIEQQGNQILLTWPSSYTNYVLESASSLLPASWIAVTSAPAAAYSEQTVTVDVSTQMQFFRLRLTQ